MYKSNFEGTIPVTLGGTVTANSFAVVGGYFGMYLKGGGSGDIVPFLIRGVVKEATKVGSQAWAVGDKVYWDSGNSRFTTTRQGNRYAGVAASVVGSGAGETTGDVLLDAPQPVIAAASAGELIGISGNAATAANATNMTSNGNDGATAYNFNDVVKAMKANNLLAP